MEHSYIRIWVLSTKTIEFQTLPLASRAILCYRKYMTNTRKIPFGIKLVIAFLVVLCTSTPYLSYAQTYLVKRVILEYDWQKGARKRRSIAAKQFAEDVLHLNPETGEQMTYEELTLYIARKADQSPRILNLILDHSLGKPVERVQVEPRAFIIHAPDQNKIQEGQELGGFILKESNSEGEEPGSLPEGE